MIEGKIVSRIKGGLTVDIGIPAFLPGSQVDIRPIRNLEKLIGNTLSFKIIKLNRRRGNVVLSRRILLEKERDALRQKTLETLEEGKIVEGVVKNITDYGAFVEIEHGVEGLLHISEMTWSKRVKHPSKIVSQNQEIEAVVLDIDTQSRKISLGLKQLYPNPWEALAKKYPLGSKIKVTYETLQTLVFL